MPLLYFILLVGPLVVFHELGHFLAARLFGVRVLSFSVGFGPVLARVVRGGTEYAVRALPFGGFVKMHGSDPLAEPEAGPPDEDSFAAKPVWQRMVIVGAGPFANVVLPVVILFAGGLLTQGQVVSSRLGTVLPNGPAAVAGLQTGDVITSVDGQPIATFDQLRRAISSRPGERTVVGFRRGDAAEDHVTLTPDRRRRVQLPELGLVDEVGRIQVLPNAQSAIVAVTPGSPAWRAGLRHGARIVAVDGATTTRWYEVDAALAAARPGGTLRIDAVALPDHPPVARDAVRTTWDGMFAAEPTTVRIALPADLTAAGPAAVGIAPARTVVGLVEADSPAARAGLRPGDRVVAVDGDAVSSFLGLQDIISKPWDDARADPTLRELDEEAQRVRLQAAIEQPRVLRVERPGPDGGAQALDLSLQLAIEDGPGGRPRLAFGAVAAQHYDDPELIDNPAPFAHAVARTSEEMSRAVSVTVLTVAGLFRGHVPMKEVGGPIFMAQLAAETSSRGWGYFFELMVWISVNLAILNMLPIPLVDGGHLVFLGVEAVKRSPVSLRARIIASNIGFILLGLLFVVVMKNDLQRVLTSFVQ